MTRILRLTVNGRREEVLADGLVTLQEVLREHLGLLTSVKDGCAQGGCGSCSVFVDGELWLSCMTPAVAVDECDITTLEALKGSESLIAIQQCFVDKAAAQCGYCTPGMIMSAAALLNRTLEPSRDEVMEALSGNACRCTGYLPIVEAVEAAAATLSGRREGDERRER